MNLENCENTERYLELNISTETLSLNTDLDIQEYLWGKKEAAIRSERSSLSQDRTSHTSESSSTRKSGGNLEFAKFLSTITRDSKVESMDNVKTLSEIRKIYHFKESKKSVGSPFKQLTRIQAFKSPGKLPFARIVKSVLSVAPFRKNSTILNPFYETKLYDLNQEMRSMEINYLLEKLDRRLSQIVQVILENLTVPGIMRKSADLRDVQKIEELMKNCNFDSFR
eukprot:NODE_199_length_13192_cov_0.539219.p9 type:complete len:225 gc:universal NODE_199_length_13192_cov_0.539219:10510-9836(-)